MARCTSKSARKIGNSQQKNKINKQLKKKKKKNNVSGGGLLNKIINKLPVEVHIPGYSFVGPGTKLKKRLARGDQGINLLDQFCKDHDIAYEKNPDNITARNMADNTLAKKAASRILARDSSIGERAAAALVAGTMKIKSKLGMGMKKKKKKNLKSNIKMRKKTKNKKKKLSIKKIIKAAKSAVHGVKDHKTAIKSALQAAKVELKKFGGKSNIKVPRVLPLPPKTGGALPLLIPILSALSAIGGIVGGASGVMKIINDAKAATRQLEESKRHNKTIESIALGKGLYMRPYKNGAGFFLNPKNL